MLSPVSCLGNAFRCSLRQSPFVTTALLLTLGCAQIAGFEDFKGASSGGKLGGTSTTSTGGGGYNLQGGSTSLGGSTGNGTTIIFAGSTSIGGSSGTGSSAPCGAVAQACCAGETCTGANTICNTTSHMCEACGSVSGRCCQARTQCLNNACCVSDKCIAAGQTCGGVSNMCQQGECQMCGKVNQLCCGTPNGSCEYGLTCNSGNCG